MPKYFYQATRGDGQSVTGQLDADGVSQALAELESGGLSVESISLASLARQTRGEGLETSSLDGRFNAVMDRREVLLPALKALADDLPATRARYDLRQLIGQLGRAKSAAELRHSRNAVQWLPLLLTGWTSETNARRISDLVAQASRECQNRSRRRRLLAYPAVLLLIVLIVLVFLCAFIVPTFGSMFDDFGLVLPAPTRVVVFISEQIHEHAIRSAVIAALVMATVYQVVRLWLHFALGTRWLGFLIAGNSAGVSAMSIFAGRLADLLSIDVSLPDALWIAGQGCGHYHYKHVAEELAREAHRAAEPLSRTPMAHNLPPNLIHALQAGPDGGPSIPLLRELSVMYSDRVNQRVDWMSGAIAQFAIIGLGIVVAFIVIAVFLPMVSLITGLS